MRIACFLFINCSLGVGRYKKEVPWLDQGVFLDSGCQKKMRRERNDRWLCRCEVESPTTMMNHAIKVFGQYNIINHPSRWYGAAMTWTHLQPKPPRQLVGTVRSSKAYRWRRGMPYWHEGPDPPVHVNKPKVLPIHGLEDVWGEQFREIIWDTRWLYGMAVLWCARVYGMLTY